ncbi:hypothetical protein HK098_006469 [Nowakowskiella sp. JEL0407]|nr:hypothetical protein HK098_006469 [Nowakowskiella sp. JEL0407]
MGDSSKPTAKKSMEALGDALSRIFAANPRPKHPLHSVFFPTAIDTPLSFTEVSLNEREKVKSEELDKDFEYAQLVSFLETRQVHDISEADLNALLKVQGFLAAFETLKDFCDARDGVLLPASETASMRGFQNAGNTCYIDSLLFAMFGRESVFDILLIQVSTDENISLLQSSLRMVVNQLRSDKLVSAWAMARLRENLIKCGWIVGSSGTNAKANKNSQQDVSELFLFLTSLLQAPFLPVEKKLFHGGKIDSNDERLSTERILVLSIPEKGQAINLPPKGKRPVASSSKPKLFSSSKSKDRESSSKRRRSKSRDKPRSRPSSMADLDIDIQITDSSTTSCLLLEDLLASYFFDNKINVERGDDEKGMIMQLTDAWQMSKLLPFFTPQNEAGDHVEAASIDYDQRNVIIPILLKRYSYINGALKRINRHILLPPEIPFGLFVTGEDSNNEEFSNYVLRLRSVVCHQGTSPRAGHYVTFMRLDATPQQSLSAIPEISLDMSTTPKLDSLANATDSQMPSLDLTIEQQTRADSTENEIVYDATPISDCFRPVYHQNSSPARNKPDGNASNPSTANNSPKIQPLMSEPSSAKNKKIADFNSASNGSEEPMWLQFDDMMPREKNLSNQIPTESKASQTSVEKDYSKIKKVGTLREVTTAMECMSANGYLLFYELVRPGDEWAKLSNKKSEKMFMEKSERGRTLERQRTDSTSLGVLSSEQRADERTAAQLQVQEFESLKEEDQKKNNNNNCKIQ